MLESGAIQPRLIKHGVAMTDEARFTGRTVLVTGASSGIGRATARALGAQGAQVVAAGRRADRLEAVVREITAAGGAAVAVTGDVRDPVTCGAWGERAVAAYGGLRGR